MRNSVFGSNISFGSNVIFGNAHRGAGCTAKPSCIRTNGGDTEWFVGGERFRSSEVKIEKILTTPSGEKISVPLNEPIEVTLVTDGSDAKKTVSIELHGGDAKVVTSSRDRNLRFDKVSTHGGNLSVHGNVKNASTHGGNIDISGRCGAAEAHGGNVTHGF